MNSAPRVVVHDRPHSMPRPVPAGAPRRRKPFVKSHRGDGTYTCVVASLSLAGLTLALYDAYQLLSFFAA